MIQETDIPHGWTYRNVKTCLCCGWKSDGSHAPSSGEEDGRDMRGREVEGQYEKEDFNKRKVESPQQSQQARDDSDDDLYGHSESEYSISECSDEGNYCLVYFEEDGESKLSF